MIYMRKEFQMSPQALLKITSPLRAKCAQVNPWKTCARQRWRTIYQNSISRMSGATLTPRSGLVIIHRCQSELENSSFKATHLAPTEFSGQFSQSRKDSSKQASTIIVVQAPCSGKGQEQIKKDLTDTKEERSHRTFQTLRRTKGPCICHILIRPQMRTGSKQ